MASNELLVETGSICWGIAPQNVSSTATTSAWLSMKYFRRVLIQIITGAWAGGTAAVTLNQATAQAGTGSKALAFTSNYTAVSTTGILTKNTVTSNTFNLDTANKTYLIEIHAQDLDIANKFSYLQLAIASPGANADLLAAFLLEYDPSYGGNPANLPDPFV